MVFFAEPHSSKKKKYPKKNLQLTLDNVVENAGALHFVFFAKSQAYRCKTGTHPHGTVSFKNFYESLQRFPRRRPKLFVYLPDKSYSNNFLIVINNSEHSQNFPWLTVIKFFEELPVEEKKSYGCHEEGNAKDFGYHNWINSSRDGNPLGIARPGLIPGSKDDIPKLCFTHLSQFGKSTVTECKWDSTELKEDEYSLDIVSGNVMHLFCVGKCNYQEPIKLHHDGDGNSQDFPDVFALSFVHNGYRYAINSQQKKSIHQLMEKTKRQEKCFKTLVSTYQSFEEDRKQISRTLLDSQYHIDIFGLKVCRTRCNMFQEVSIMPVINGVLRLTEDYELNMMEIVSVHLSSIFLPNYKIFFGIACELISSFLPSSIKDEYHGIYLGLLVSKLTTSLRNEYQKGNQFVSLKAFEHDVFPKVPDRVTWKNLVNKHLSLCLHTFAAGSNISAREKPVFYRKVKNLQVLSIDHLGEVLSEQMILERTYIGLYPSWMRDFSDYSQDFPANYYFRNQYSLGNDLMGDNVLKFAKNISAAMSYHWNRPFSV